MGDGAMIFPGSTLYPGTGVFPQATTETPPIPAPVPDDTMAPSGEARMTVSIYDRDYQRLGQVPDYVSCSVQWQWLGVGGGELVVGEDDPIASYLLLAAEEVVPVVVEVNQTRWSGRVVTAVLEREGPVGSGTITATMASDWVWLLRMLASQNGQQSVLTGMPQFDTRTGPLASVAADFINASASRLTAPVLAIKPVPDVSVGGTLNARMDTLADLLTAPLFLAGVTMSAEVWLPNDPQPDGALVTLTTPTVVFSPKLLADKPWLQWTDGMSSIGKMTLQASHPAAYRAIVGLDGQEAARIYDEYINAPRRLDLGDFALPEVYTDKSDAALGLQSQSAGAAAVAATGGVSASFVIEDASPFSFGSDYVVGDMATVVVGGSVWRQRITRVTATDDRDGGLVFTPLLGDQSPDISGSEMMVQALARVAAGVRSIQTGR